MSRVEFTVAIDVDGQRRLVAAYLELDSLSIDPRASVLVIGGDRYRPTTEVFPGATASQFVAHWFGWRDNAMAQHFVRTSGPEPG